MNSWGEKRRRVAAGGQFLPPADFPYLSLGWFTCLGSCWLEVQGADQGCASFDPVLLRLVCGDLHSNHVVGGVARC